ncbi:hypothetical protein [Streptomyces winkii]|uniref:hypothetical protein n=1 Tax=Streptomyces winkii TaxID=3051178 RepID=UPI0028D86796|nr:hypothetical protein [Streptomyces sp. DSM 40971]
MVMDIATFLLAATGAVLAIVLIIKQNDLERRATALRQDVAVILDHLGISGRGPSIEKVSALAAEGKKLEAIRMYREITGANPVEAREAVERAMDKGSADDDTDGTKGDGTKGEGSAGEV